MAAAEKLELLRLLEEKHRRRARDDLNAYCRYIEIPGVPISEDEDCETFYPDSVTPAAHHELINRTLMDVDAGLKRRVMIFMPPGSAKSTYGSVAFPTWFMGRKPGRNVICTSYGSTLAARFGRKCRQITRSKQFKEVFGAELVSDNRAADDWALTNGSTYMAGGILSGITGNRADGLVIDDPVKGRADADSQTIRDKAWEEYKTSLRTRLKPNGFISIIQCMTGDTPILMADGTEKPLRDIRPGDEIATYDGGNLAASTVLNWSNNGSDSVYKISMKSGRIVRANERHPFLVLKDGKEQWVRLKNLRAGGHILRVTGVSGAASCAQSMSATGLQDAEACATHITTRKDGLKEFARHLLGKILRPVSAQSSSIATGSPSETIRRFSPSKAGFALFVAALQKRLETLSIGMTSCALTTATTPRGCADSCATTAIWQSEEGKHQKYSKQLPNTSDFIPDEIVSIEFAGAEDVFDIQVDRTENFIANGLVSHNTRWHEDDLSGRILPQNWDGQSGWVTARDGEQWYVLCLQAQCETDSDPLGRKRGEWLWTDWFSPEHWAQEKVTQGSRNWDALYQQKPKPSEGGTFKRPWVKRYRTAPDGGIIVQSWDTGNKPGELNDPSVCTTWLVTDLYWYLLHVWRDRVDFPTLLHTVKNHAATWNPIGIVIEDKASGTQLIQTLRAETNLPVIAFDPTPHGDKIIRAQNVSPLVESGRVLLPEEAPWLIDFESEFFGFPLSTTKDQVDSVSQFLKWAHKDSMGLQAWGSGRQFAGHGAYDSKGSHLDLDAGYGTVRSDTDLDGY